jgi:glycerol-3-phosphate acyltransferase PlsY
MTRDHLLLLCLALAAYVAGSIPFGLIVGLSKGIDPRRAGSGNIGATNVGRLLGVRFFALVFSLDFLKGMLPTLAAASFVHFHFPQPDAWVFVFWLLVGFAAILGHMYSLFIGFKGGKGVATSLGVVFGIWPYFTVVGCIVAGIWILTFLLTRYVSVASLAAAWGFPIAYVAIAHVKAWQLFGAQHPLLIFSVVIAVMVTYKHRANIARLREGSEPRISRKRGDPIDQN